MNNNLNNNQEFNMNYEGIYQYASFGKRLVALIVNTLWICLYSLITYLVMVIVTTIVNFFTYGTNSDLTGYLVAIGMFIPMLIMIGVSIWQNFLADASKKHGSQGRRSQKNVVLNKNGQFLSYGENILRGLLKYLISAIPFGVIVSIILMFTNEKHQALHDLILGTVVVNNNN